MKNLLCLFLVLSTCQQGFGQQDSIIEMFKNKIKLKNWNSNDFIITFDGIELGRIYQKYKNSGYKFEFKKNIVEIDSTGKKTFSDKNQYSLSDLLIHKSVKYKDDKVIEISLELLDYKEIEDKSIKEKFDSLSKNEIIHDSSNIIESYKSMTIFHKKYCSWGKGLSGHPDIIYYITDEKEPYKYRVSIFYNIDNGKPIKVKIINLNNNFEITIIDEKQINQIEMYSYDYMYLLDYIEKLDIKLPKTK